ncbi:hypothetical protein JOD54_001927 [Actinokineospora baliensis]|nr:hypothetical protein [Actinokineospora baliensis]
MEKGCAQCRVVGRYLMVTVTLLLIQSGALPGVHLGM